jgi:SAM-dependent methyltransferase
MFKESIPYKRLCTEYYELDKPQPPEDAFSCYLKYVEEANEAILEPMCGSGRFLVPLLKKGYPITGFDYSKDMLNVCREKCHKLGLKANLLEASFKTFSLPQQYNLIFIPSGSFCLLATQNEVNEALKLISNLLKPGGKFVFEIETLASLEKSNGIWHGKWVNKSDGSKIVVNTLSQFDSISRIETVLCRYELWEENKITCTEVEDFRLRLYEQNEIDLLLTQYGLNINGKWHAQPYTNINANENTSVILYECVKSEK